MDFTQLLSKFKGDSEERDWIASEKSSNKPKFSLPKRKSLKLKEVTWFLSQLTTTQASGIPMFRSLAMIAKMRHGTLMGEKALRIQEATSEGLGLAQALEKIMPELGTLIFALINAGEASGKMEDALRRSIALLEGRSRLRRKLRSAMTYPAMVVLVCVGLVTALLTVVVPKFKEIYASVGSQLPKITQLVIALADRLPFVALLVAVVVGSIFYLFWLGKQNQKVALYIDRTKLKLPILGNIIYKAAIARVSQTLASLVSSGVSLLDSLSLASKTAGTLTHSNALLDAKEKISDGSTLAFALSSTQAFPELMTQLVSVGEESGSLAEVLEKYSLEATEELESATDALTSLIEPLLMVFIGVVVAGFVVALYLPVINLGKILGN